MNQEFGTNEICRTPHKIWAIGAYEQLACRNEMLHDVSQKY